jgi:hypothetical protein
MPPQDSAQSLPSLEAVVRGKSDKTIEFGLVKSCRWISDCQVAFVRRQAAGRQTLNDGPVSIGGLARGAEKGQS